MSNHFRAALWMSGAIISFSLMAVAGRAASAELDTFEIMMYRSLIGFTVVVAITTARNQWAHVSTQDIGTHTLRNLAHFCGQNLWFYALTLMPLAQLFALEFTTPIWVLLLAPLILNVKIRPMGLLAAAIAFVGIIIVAQPGAAPLGPGFLPAALCAVCFAFSLIFTKKLTERHSTVSILFYLTAMQLVFGAIFAGYDGDITVPSAAAIPSLVIIGLAGLTAHFCITSALKIAPASVVAPYDFVRLPVIAIVGALFYSEPLQASVLLGAILIFGGNYLNIMHENKLKREVTTS
ncbi:DMT family transporter [Cognatishimia sp. 1_MG-2023]|uniref:DMT family transporter n=1 Tax=Cognatishimia sp. 1_MG-2023 TaxID=3062642 RepID=UPI0026E46BE5|nr:DMT family transporter [Cognatishimia sp. 1_MG-2023]MDO6725474.1 DMT family transporter [Cognatishimia sp. 1_MG-2023]